MRLMLCKVRPVDATVQDQVIPDQLPGRADLGVAPSGGVLAANVDQQAAYSLHDGVEVPR